jgi:hypothetical protein
MLVFTLDLISQYPYAIVNLIDLVLSPLTLGVLCHPETWSENYYLQAIASGLKVEDIFLNPVGFCQTFMENSAGYLATWIVGMGMLRLLPTVISQYE